MSQAGGKAHANATVKKTRRIGDGTPGPGRPKGMPNKATMNAREAIAKLVDDNAANLQEWIQQIAKQDGPKAAWQCFMDVVEYHIPKLARTEHVGDGGGPVRIIATNADEKL